MVPEGQDALFIVGDAHQRIYRHQVILGRCGIDIRGRGRTLKINYRTTDETRKWAVSLLQNIQADDLDGGTDDQKGYKSLFHGVFPELRHFGDFTTEVEAIGQHIPDLISRGDDLKDMCLVARTNTLLDRYEKALTERGMTTCRIRRSEPEDRRAAGLRLATLHRVKGLEFDHVIAGSVNHGVIPLDLRLCDTSDPVVRHETEVQERALLYVAATRDRKTVLLTSYGKPSDLIKSN